MTTIAISPHAVAVNASAEEYMNPLMTTTNNKTARIGIVTRAAIFAVADRFRSDCKTANSMRPVSNAASRAQGRTCTKSVMTWVPVEPVFRLLEGVRGWLV